METEMKKMAALLFIPFALAAFNAAADELDPIPAAVPQGLVVRIAPDGKREVFKASLNQGIVDSDAAAAAVVKEAVKAGNMINSVTPASELDRTSSDDSWHWWWGPRDECYYGPGHPGYYGGYGYTYGYNYGGSYYNYWPSYSYYNAGYQYNTYYSDVHYGYHTGYHYSDQSGWHYGGHYGWHGDDAHPWGH